jgi:TldD protein
VPKDPSPATSPSDADPLIQSAVLERVLSAALVRGAEMAEVFCEDRHSSGAVLDDGRIEELSSGRERGAGIRVVVGETTGFAHTADLSEAGLLEAAAAAASVAREGGSRVRVAPLGARRAAAHRSDVLPSTVAKATKLELLTRADDAARSAGAAVSPLCSANWWMRFAQ